MTGLLNSKRRIWAALALGAAPLLAGAATPIPGPAAPQAAPADDADPVIRVVVLGSGNPVPSRDQAGTTILVQAGGQSLLIDCGRGCTTRLAAFDPALVGRIDKLFLTHLHSDHVVGIPDLLLNGWTQGRNQPLHVWGPKGTDAMMKTLRKAYAEDVRYRLRDGIPADDAGLKRLVTRLGADGIVYDENGLRVRAFRVHHGDVPSYGYRIEYGGRSVFISGDTGPTPALAANGEGVDLALLEVASPPMVDYVRQRFSADQAAKILDIHLTAPQAAAVMAAIRPKLAVYYHTVVNCRAEAALKAATAAEYPGPIAVSRDLTEIRVYADRVQALPAPGQAPCETR